MSQVDDTQARPTIGEALVTHLSARGITHVFGIPGVHTIELYRGLANSGIRHITPRHEQGAGFMADGYARVNGQPAAVFVITGPGISNTLTPMAQARADSVPMLTVSGANATGSIGKGLGHLHELPNQQALVAQVALVAEHVETAEGLDAAVDRAFAPLSGTQHIRPGPTHIQIPLDIAGKAATAPKERDAAPQQSVTIAAADSLADLRQRLRRCARPVLLVGGGAKAAAPQVRALAERMNAPVVQTANARGLMFDHPLSVPASPSLEAVRNLLKEADLVLALGTEMGPTDYDMYARGLDLEIADLARVDICEQQLHRYPADLAIHGTVMEVLDALADLRPEVGQVSEGWGSAKAAAVRSAAWQEIGEDYQNQVSVLNALRLAAPRAIMVGDSTQPIYAGNLYYDHDRVGGWFNAATGYGALGFAIPAAVGAAIAAPGTRVICIAGDGGAQFSMPEIMTAVDENLPITFVIWNNHGYQEIARSMDDVGVTVLGCDPTPPDFAAAAQSFGIPFQSVSSDPATVSDAIRAFGKEQGPSMLEIRSEQYQPHHR
ncbi:5-guanidino-2-oxopentanoate decarboxylase [Phaeobacter sp.]|uniref:5-guanidino-2-oxopentanoate decarboxylase n=1 Tax=Phaeobacter sp. TaxID=1902409 RepID=UPI0025E3B5F8|nr:5-guanidino-2-oxopentanoate decarboxylase [Phaeobacter sp.]